MSSYDEDFEQDLDDDGDDEVVAPQWVPVVTNKHVKPETTPKHAKCSICELASQSHPHALCELTPEVVAKTQAEFDGLRKQHIDGGPKYRRPKMSDMRLLSAEERMDALQRMRATRQSR